MGEIRSCTCELSNRCRQFEGSNLPPNSSLLKDYTSKQSSTTIRHEGSTNDDYQWDEVRINIWGLASALYTLEDLQIFAETVSPSDPIDIKRTAEILAKAQLELRELINSRTITKNGRR
jgi:hypothetical protein